MLELEQKAGSVQISEDVVAVIAGIAASATEGVASMSSGITEGLAKRVSGKNITKGISVEADETEAQIHVRAIIRYGQKIHEVCSGIQDNVREAVESMTGLKVVAVNVKVEGVEMVNREPQE